MSPNTPKQTDWIAIVSARAECVAAAKPIFYNEKSATAFATFYLGGQRRFIIVEGIDIDVRISFGTSVESNAPLDDFALNPIALPASTGAPPAAVS
jgi:hypothetical protein